ncbi:MAG: SagB/ThcOx family dehydrogenase [Minisyncoccia bacterium]
MKIFQLYHDASKNKRHPGVMSHPETWPQDWTTTYYKKYERLPKFKLQPPSEDLAVSLGTVIRNRHSTREYTKVITEQELSDLLFYSCGQIDADALYGRGRRAYASGGGRFPLEIYLFVIKKIGLIDAGVYHYDVASHTLNRIDTEGSSPEEIRKIFFYPETPSASVIVVFSAVFERMYTKYKERSYRHVLLEAGGAGEQMYLVAGALGIGCVGMSGFVDESIEARLDIDGVQESVLYSVVLG